MSLINSRKKNTLFYIMLVLGVAMIAIGLAPIPNIMFPPVLTGLGFLALAWGLK
ncbi:hypothetical protein [Ponticaulis profundi]|uniref:Uncharacterized protein n=1 Tax=Ponticaulis profundi TaxID=2665222 RepID=A0ABW1S822_9PROT